MMNAKIRQYVNGTCSDDEREEVREYIKADFYHAFDVIDAMRDKAYHDLPTRLEVEEMVVPMSSSNVCYYEMEDVCHETASIAESIFGKIVNTFTNTSKKETTVDLTDLEMCQAEMHQDSILGLLNKYLASD